MAGHSVVRHVAFSLTGDDDHLAASFGQITSYELFGSDGKPITGGVYDPRLGTISHEYRCTTCAHGRKLCPGHRGHIRLRAAVLQPAAIVEVRKWLRVICLRCGEILVDREKYAGLPPSRRLAAAATVATEGRRCRCGEVHPKIVKDPEDYFTFWAEPPTPQAKARAGPRGAYKLYPDAIRAMFERVSPASVAALGREMHPKNLVLLTVPVATNSIRPGVRAYGGGGSSYHDSTNLIQSLLKRNGQLPERLPEAMGPLGPAGQVDGELDRAVTNQQQIYYELVKGSASTSATQGSAGRRGLVLGSRQVHSLLRNLSRKEGRIRANLLGKRVFEISRSTISGCSQLRIDEVGIPLQFARTLQVEETVQEYNRDWLMTFFLNGHRQYPGCTILTRRATGESHDVGGLRDYTLEIGDKLKRDVVTGDLATFNRQPTLERSSMGTHKVVVLQDPSKHTFQFNVLACENYNADEVQNHHCPQQVAAAEGANTPSRANSVSVARKCPFAPRMAVLRM